MPLVSVVTPTWRRHDLLLGRCIPSVRAQTWPRIEHVIVTGPDLELISVLRDYEGVVIEMPENVADGGVTPRRVGMEAASGEFIAYLDDDNAYREQHLTQLAIALLTNPEAGFAYSRMVRHGLGDVVGQNPPVYGQIDSSLIMHRRALMAGAWSPSAGYSGPHSTAPDWETVERWLAAGHRWAFVPEVTLDYWHWLPGGSRADHADSVSGRLSRGHGTVLGAHISGERG